MPARTLAPESLPMGLAALPVIWAGSAACNQWLIALLDAQTGWCKDMERWTAQWMQAWMGPAALQRPWGPWTQIWVDALRHDATER